MRSINVMHGRNFQSSLLRTFAFSWSSSVWLFVESRSNPWRYVSASVVVAFSIISTLASTFGGREVPESDRFDGAILAIFKRDLFVTIYFCIKEYKLAG